MELKLKPRIFLDELVIDHNKQIATRFWISAMVGSFYIRCLLYTVNLKVITLIIITRHSARMIKCIF